MASLIESFGLAIGKVGCGSVQHEYCLILQRLLRYMAGRDS